MKLLKTIREEVEHGRSVRFMPVRFGIEVRVSEHALEGRRTHAIVVFPDRLDKDPERDEEVMAQIVEASSMALDRLPFK